MVSSIRDKVLDILSAYMIELVSLLSSKICRSGEGDTATSSAGTRACQCQMEKLRDSLFTNVLDSVQGAPYSDFEFELQGMGFERGWGDRAQRVSEMVHLPLDILQAPDPSSLESFIGMIPMVFNVVVVSPHRYFGQANVLGLPDTGGQIVYILDQVRALENEMISRIQKQVLDITPKILIVTRLIPNAKGTTCSHSVHSTSGEGCHTYILRVPFRTENGILRKWISRFDVWPYLETFADDASNEIAAELQGIPDLIIGNYSDGNLVASLLSYKLGITQACRCNIAHASEKIKYPDSYIYWRKYEDKHHFASQFTADLIAMNNADFIINSTYQEIAGRERRLAALHGSIEELLYDPEQNEEHVLLSETFGLTVVEAMTCGLPSFATRNGGLLRSLSMAFQGSILILINLISVEHGISGFHIDPHQLDKVAALLINFFEQCREDPSYWHKISDGGLKRIYERYTWKIYSERLLTLTGVYGFWKHVSKLERRETRRYWRYFIF
ncbi:hypothetical protein GH714_029100 [Hevea brasiliensis]|uniref:sucrose synthase n=1 Tax=Hevea brasiliensis TaxID=3981 RepID=A0A6A6KM37_HEVBR|nr:hypothetical protein GH714_029100 [Hevea brasiliensis]